MRRSGLFLITGLALLASTGWLGIAQAQWTPLTNGPPNFMDTCVLLTDGRAMCHVYQSNAWLFLTPDINGSYVNGTWSASATMPNGTDTAVTTAVCTPSCPYQPLYFGSSVLADGQVVVIGGEFVGTGPNSMIWTAIGFMYNPVTDSWSAQLQVPFVPLAGSPAAIIGGIECIGDAQVIVIDNGTMLLADSTCGSLDLAAFNPATLTFTALGSTGKADSNNEENWNILPDGTVLTVDARVASQFEIYNPVTNNWTSGATPVNLADTGTNTNSREVGPGVLRPDGKMIYFSGNNLGQNALYDTVTATWSNTAAMDFPVIAGISDSVADGVASLLPNGNVLVMASPVTNTACGAAPCGVFNRPSNFYEFDYATNTLVAVTNSPNAASFIAYQGRMLLLPTGEVLLTAYNQNATQDVTIYSNGGAPQDAWRPVITVGRSYVAPGNTYAISGTLFNGFSEGATYGDDAAMSTNYPLVRITNQGTGHVFYARTHDHTSMGVDLVGSTKVITTQFDAPAGLEDGASELVVVVNGIPSQPIIINDCRPDPLSQGYWHRQCLGLPETGDPATTGIDPGRNGRGPQEPTEPEFQKELLPAVNLRLQALLFEFQGTCGGMHAEPASDTCEKALKQFTALLLNLESDRLQLGCAIDPVVTGCDSDNLEDLVDEIADLINDGTEESCAKAQACSDAVNKGLAVVERLFVADSTTSAPAPVISEAVKAGTTPEGIGITQPPFEPDPANTAVSILQTVTAGHQESAVSDAQIAEEAPVGDEDILRRHLAILSDISSSAEDRTNSTDTLLTALSGGYELETRMEIVEGLISRIDDSLFSLLVEHLKDIRDEARDFDREELAARAERLLKPWEQPEE